MTYLDFALFNAKRNWSEASQDFWLANNKMEKSLAEHVMCIPCSVIKDRSRVILKRFGWRSPTMWCYGYEFPFAWNRYNLRILGWRNKKLSRIQNLLTIVMWWQVNKGDFIATRWFRQEKPTHNWGMRSLMTVLWQCYNVIWNADCNQGYFALRLTVD